MPPLDAALDSVIDGISVRVSWAMLEPPNNEWSWDKLDRQFVGPSVNTERFSGPFEHAVNKGRAGYPKYWEVYFPGVPAISALIASP